MPTTTPLDTRPAVKSRSAFPALLLGILLGLLVALVAVPAAVRHVGASMRNRVSLAFLGRHDAIDISQPTVIASYANRQSHAKQQTATQELVARS